ncbi:MAG: hypothetical protein Q7J28_09375 [Caulobacter sp.]|nr:hypothetical protein [Caulobacter sp.]
MHIRALTDRRPLEAITLHSGAGAAALWLAVLWQELPKLAYGPLCSEAQGLLGHCPLCLPAAVLTLISFAGGVLLMRDLRRG